MELRSNGIVVTQVWRGPRGKPLPEHVVSRPIDQQPHDDGRVDDDRHRRPSWMAARISSLLTSTGVRLAMRSSRRRRGRRELVEQHRVTLLRMGPTIT
ncbi:MAG: hypothetical protein ACRDTE_12840 [Pseudonocardiaceae bacterium]